MFFKILKKQKGDLECLFAIFFSKNRIILPKIRTLKNIRVSLLVSRLQKIAKSFVFYRKIAIFDFPESGEKFRKTALNSNLWYLLKAYI
ncbi:hypothetical protein H740_11462 [Campylobacter showae CC57C]|uniref:Uncharacterized protein n=1 Tax=Campylobacter showae CC57C TaxID=1073353 RepID=M3GVM3_9BACT|nr:hypothetical protein H740_11462 [Campylobacter showae CC57C]